MKQGVKRKSEDWFSCNQWKHFRKDWHPQIVIPPLLTDSHNIARPLKRQHENDAGEVAHTKRKACSISQALEQTQTLTDSFTRKHDVPNSKDQGELKMALARNSSFHVPLFHGWKKPSTSKWSLSQMQEVEDPAFSCFNFWREILPPVEEPTHNYNDYLWWRVIPDEIDVDIPDAF